MHRGDQTGEGQGCCCRQGERKWLGNLELFDWASGIPYDEQRNPVMIWLTLHGFSFLRHMAAALRYTKLTTLLALGSSRIVLLLYVFHIFQEHDNGLFE
ncbi:hypothetical protein D3C78_846590 [compost metagenome]